MTLNTRTSHDMMSGNTRPIEVSAEHVIPCAHAATTGGQFKSGLIANPVLPDDLPSTEEKKESSEDIKPAKQKEQGMNKWTKTLIGTSVLVMVLFVLIV